MAEQKSFINDRLDHLIQRAEIVKAEIAAMPELPKLEKGIAVKDGDSQQATTAKPTADASGFPVVGHFTGALAEKYSKRDKKSTKEDPKPWMDRSVKSDSLTIEARR